MTAPGAESRPGELLLDEVDLGPGVVAGFTGRDGGTSRPPFATLNLGAHVGDDPRAVAANRARLAAALGCRVAFVDQVHGRTVVDVPGAGSLPDDVLQPVGTGDALVTVADDVALAVLVADCVPVLLADPVHRVVAAVHAGRRGLVAGVVEAALDAVVARGARLDALRAVVGPSIAGGSYEVPAALRDEVAGVVPETATTTRWGTPGLDLPAGVAAVLRRSGVHDVVRSARDTADDEALYSYRRAPETGRFVGIVRLEPGFPGATTVESHS